jgi:hypothetical protein
MGETARCIAQPATIDFEGKKYKLSPITIEVEGAFEQWLEDRAHDALRRQLARRRITEQDYREDRKALVAEIAACIYSYGSSVSAKALASVPGQKQMLFLALKAAAQDEGCDVDMALVDRIYDKMFDEVMALMEQLNADPNPQAPAPGGEPGCPSEPSAPPSSKTGA